MGRDAGAGRGGELAREGAAWGGAAPDSFDMEWMAPEWMAPECAAGAAGAARAPAPGREAGVAMPMRPREAPRTQAGGATQRDATQRDAARGLKDEGGRAAPLCHHAVQTSPFKTRPGADAEVAELKRRCAEATRHALEAERTASATQAAFLAKSIEADELRRELLSERALSAGQCTELERQIGGLQRQLEESEQRVRVGEGIVGRLSAFLKNPDAAEPSGSGAFGNSGGGAFGGGDGDGSFAGLGAGHSNSAVGHGSHQQWPALVGELR